MLEQITPIILTYNEEPNLGRTLARLSWARSIVVVDSFSTDATLEIARAHANVTVVQRAFDDFAHQLNFALAQDSIRTEWVMVLDADYLVPQQLSDEISTLSPAPDVSGYRCAFRYCVEGAPLRASLYPPNVVLFRRGHGSYYNDGHAYRLRLSEGRVVDLHARIDHDDRKPLSRWLASQNRYASEEAAKLAASGFGSLAWQDKLRKVPMLAPLAVMPYCLFAKRCILDGTPGLIYTAQRTVAELVLSLHVLEARVRATRR